MMLSESREKAHYMELTSFECQAKCSNIVDLQRVKAYSRHRTVLNDYFAKMLKDITARAELSNFGARWALYQYLIFTY